MGGSPDSRRRRIRQVVVWGPVVLLAACGGEEERTNTPRPATPVNLTAAVTEERVLVSPAAVGAGPVVVIVSNQSADAHEVTLEAAEAAGAAGRLSQTTSPINPDGTATIKADLAQGTYRLSAGGEDIRSAAIEVGAPRPSAQDELLRP
jgi:hypothetical protein